MNNQELIKTLLDHLIEEKDPTALPPLLDLLVETGYPNIARTIDEDFDKVWFIIPSYIPDVVNQIRLKECSLEAIEAEEKRWHEGWSYKKRWEHHGPK